jgi:hypothetical protein
VELVAYRSRGEVGHRDGIAVASIHRKNGGAAVHERVVA